MARVLNFLTRQQKQTGTNLRELAVYECGSGHGTFNYPCKVTEIPDAHRRCPICSEFSPFLHRKRETAPYHK